MERWRCFFNGAGEDLWTVIEQAILLAANDYPSEFQRRRCDIAEVLFTKRPDQGDTRASASVVTNCTNGTEGEDVRDEQASRQRKNFDHAPAPLKEQGRAPQSTSPLVEPGADGNVVSQTAAVCNIKKTLIDSMQSDAATLQALRTLEGLDIGVDVLKTTEIGKQVSNLKRHACTEIRLMAKGLVRHWKALVDDWMKSEENGDVERSMQEEEMQSITPNRAIPCHIQVEIGQHYHSELPEERGSTSRAELTRHVRGDAHVFPKERVGEDAGNGAVDMLPVRNASISKLAPSRPAMNLDIGSRLTANGKDSNKEASTDQNAKYFDQRLKDLSCKDHMMELAKRKLPHECHDGADNAKKQHKGLAAYSKDLQKGGMTYSSSFATQRSQYRS